MNVLIHALLAAAVAGTAASYIESDDFQHCFMVGDYLITDSQPQWEWVTDTPLTDKAEELLKEKYGREFVCSYFLYQLEFSLCMDVKAAPADDPQMEFYVDLRGGNSGLEVYSDAYINMLCMDELSDWLKEGVDIPEAKGTVLYSTGSLTEQEVADKRFSDGLYCPHGFDVILITDSEGAEAVNARIGDVVRDIERRLEGCDFYIYVGSDKFYDPEGGVNLGSKLNYDELFYRYDCRGARQKNMWIKGGANGAENKA